MGACHTKLTACPALVMHCSNMPIIAFHAPVTILIIILKMKTDTKPVICIYLRPLEGSAGVMSPI